MQLSEANQQLHVKLVDVLHICGDSIRSFAQQPEACVVQLVSAGVINGDTTGITRFLFDAHEQLPAKAVGKYIAAPADLDRDVAAARAYELTSSFLEHFDFSDDTPVQCLRKLLSRTRMPPGTQRLVVLI
jgi:Sec7-like guanine-nucleotide exchange factor